jgi:peptidoglycan/xylan/chitin deacetylase (PgdA/CDA1 family)
MSDLLVLCYHSVSETWPAPTSVKPEDLERQLSAFVRRGYRGATFSDALTAPPAEKTLVVTFDDAHRSVLETAAPILGRLGLPATVFVPTDYPDTGRPMAWDGYDPWLGTEFESELGCLGWDELRGLVARGWEIGSHTKSHPHLPRLDAEAIGKELRESREVCEEKMGERCWSVAYPYGDHDDRVLRAAAEAGYRFGATIPRKATAPVPFGWPRVGVYFGEGPERLVLRARTRRFQPSFAVQAALKVKGLRRR